MNVSNKIESSAVCHGFNAMAVVVFVTLLLTTHRAVGLVLAAVALAGIAWRSARGTDAQTTAAQLVLTCGLLADWQHTQRATPLIIVGAAIMALVVAQPVLRGLVNRPRMEVANLPGYRPAREALIDPGLLAGATIALIVVLAASATVRAPIWPVLTAAAITLAAVAVVGAQALRARLGGDADAEAFRAALLRYDPRFALYFSAPDETEYHVAMWLPYLERIGTPFVVIVREAKSVPVIAANTGTPVIYCPAVPFVDRAVTDRMTACFYVNNGAKNSHMVRFGHLTHIQLLHGDSDKASSANPVTAMFDRIFVAGQAGIDRYASAGVHIPADRFDIVGRPQVETISVATTPISEIADRTVLYATTWVGLYTDANYCSLAVGQRIIDALLDRDCRIILRPHPYTHKNAETARQAARLEQILAENRAKTGREHVFGAAATRTMSLFDCINAADALVSDISSVASDWLYSGKPLALTNMLAAGTDEFGEAYPLARAAYVIDQDAANVAAVCDDLLDRDPLAETRRSVKAYYLGDFDDVGYADAFVTAARSYVEHRDAPPVQADSLAAQRASYAGARPASDAGAGVGVG